MAPVNRIVTALLAALALCLAQAGAHAAPVEGLYEGVVAGDATESGRVQAAGDALRQVVVRITGRAAAASDPALASLYADARRMVQTYRSTAPGQISVAFDAGALDEALQRAGQRMWSRERPVTLIVLAQSKPGAAHSLAAGDQDLHRDIVQAAQLRGLPLAWVTGLPPSASEPRYQDALAGRLDPLRDLAHDLGADALLVGRLQAGATAWSYAGPGGSGTLSGSAGEAIDALADQLGRELASTPNAAGSVRVVVHGVRDLAGYAATSAALAALPNVRAVMLEEARGDQLTFLLALDGDPGALARAARDGGRFSAGDASEAGGTLDLVLKP